MRRFAVEAALGCGVEEFLLDLIVLRVQIHGLFQELQSLVSAVQVREQGDGKIAGVEGRIRIDASRLLPELCCLLKVSLVVEHACEQVACLRVPFIVERPAQDANFVKTIGECILGHASRGGIQGLFRIFAVFPPADRRGA